MLECFSRPYLVSALDLFPANPLVLKVMLMHGFDLVVWFLQVDLQLASGEYHLSEQKKAEKKQREKQEQQTKKSTDNKLKRDASHIPPEVSLLPWLSQYKNRNRNQKNSNSTPWTGYCRNL